MASTSSETSSSVSFIRPLSISEPPAVEWDVFLSFCGKDTRYKFISHLYAALDRHGIRTYKDNLELRTGEVITEALSKAIKESKTYVVVFSENYAFSSWCLDELVEIYNCYQNKDRLIIGVYYNIEPSVVRYQTVKFEEAFKKHEKRCRTGWFDKISSALEDVVKVKKWRSTLKKVAGFSGQHLSAERDEADIINQIVDEILLQIKPKTLYVADHPVGLDSRVRDITENLSSGIEGIIKIGLYGMGGVGKTTLAKALFNQLLPGGSFNGSCFLAEVREASRGANGLVSLQQQLIDDVLKSKKKVKVHNVEEGKMFIRERICRTKVLVLVDDIDNLKQYESLVGPFAPGSIVIITTKDKEMLVKIKVEPRYRFEVKVLNDSESLALFTQHAFGDTEPDNSFLVLFKDILSLAGGLPIALEVFGTYLSTQSKIGWESYIEKLQRTPENTIQQKLLISLDSLESDDPLLKEIFLDIACFFIGRGIEEVVNIMGTYYLYVGYKIDILKKKCLLMIDDSDVLRMHDLLRDMGRAVVRNKSIGEPGKHSRLWVSKDICEVLKKHKGTEEIEGIIPTNFYYQDALEGVSFATETFNRMRKLRFLYLKNVNLNGSFEQAFENLRWLRWDCCPLKCLPFEFYPQDIAILELRYSNIRTLWELNMDSRVFGKLTTLDMSYALDLTSTPDFTKLPCLKILNFNGCKRLKKVHISIGSLVWLVSLNLGGCVNLSSLPHSICNLGELNSLNIGGCWALKEFLTEVNAWGLTVWKLPNYIGHLSKLVEPNLLSDASYSSTTHWDVFLSFRGIDKRDTFIDHLYKALVHSSLTTYIDNPEVRCRETISHVLPRAIEESTIYVVVFSKDYAYSDRCLDELVEILDCNKKIERLVIPVFYNISPADVRHQMGSFKEAFERHRFRFRGEMQKVNKWRLTLTEVAGFSGFHISENSESDCIQAIVEKVARIVSTEGFNLDEYLVGIDSVVEELYQILSIESNDVRAIGIFGMGGIGKTTIAKALYNKYSNKFDISCFIEDAEQYSQVGSPVLLLLNQILMKLLREKACEVADVETGMRQLKKILCSKKALLILDDLRSTHLGYFLERLNNFFSAGSRIIITSRDEGLQYRLELNLS